MLKVLIAPNSFKECADSVTIAGYMAGNLAAWAEEKYNIRVDPIIRPISDGGDGFLTVMEKIFNLKKRAYKISSPWADSKIICEVGFSDDYGTIYIESANILGLKLIPKDKRHPLLLSSRGMGELLQQLKKEFYTGQIKSKKIIIGIGGTGICDFGLGMCSVLGLKILDKNSNELIPIAENLCKAADVVWESPNMPFNIEVILDVNAPLLGSNGASITFSPQKGATEREVEVLENGISNFVQILNKKFPKDSGKTLYGAGGGLAGAFHYFLDAKYKSAADFIHEDLMINNKDVKADLIITGEGSFDSQTFLKKGAMIIIEEFKGMNIPIFVCAGNIQRTPELDNYKELFFIDISNYFPSREESIRNIKEGINKATEEVLSLYFSKKVSS